MPDGETSVPSEAIEIVRGVIQGQKVESGIDAGFVGWRALKALQDAGYPIRWVCSGCCNCTPSNFTDPLCDGEGRPL